MNEAPQPVELAEVKSSSEVPAIPRLLRRIINLVTSRVSKLLGVDSGHEHTPAHHTHQHKPATQDVHSPKDKNVESKLEQGRAIVKVIGKCKNKGNYIGLPKSLQKALGLKTGDKAHVLVGGGPAIELIVEDISPEVYNESMGGNVVTTNDEADQGHSINVAKPSPTQAEPADKDGHGYAEAA